MKNPTEIYNGLLTEIERIMGKDTETSNFELDNIGQRIFNKKYIGTFSSDKIPKLKKEEMCIANLDSSKQPGSHWVSLYCNEMGRCYFYDSFGRTIKSFKNLQKKNKIIQEAKDYDPEQEYEESNCGQRCVAWLCCCEIMPMSDVLTI